MGHKERAAHDGEEKRTARYVFSSIHGFNTPRSLVCCSLKSTKESQHLGAFTLTFSMVHFMEVKGASWSPLHRHSPATECSLIALKSQNNILPRRVKEAEGRQITAFFVGYYPCKHVSCQPLREKFAT